MTSSIIINWLMLTGAGISSFCFASSMGKGKHRDAFGWIVMILIFLALSVLLNMDGIRP